MQEITRVVQLNNTIKDNLTKYQIVNGVYLDGNLDNDIVKFQIDGSTILNNTHFYCVYLQ